MIERWAQAQDAKGQAEKALKLAQAAFKKAQETKANEDYEKALALAEESEKLSPSAPAKFFIGASAFTLGLNILQEANSKKNCAMSRRAQDLMTKVQINMPGGGSIEPKTAQQILGYAAQYSTNADQMVRAYCK